MAVGRGGGRAIRVLSISSAGKRITPVRRSSRRPDETYRIGWPCSNAPVDPDEEKAIFLPVVFRSKRTTVRLAARQLTRGILRGEDASCVSRPRRLVCSPCFAFRIYPTVSRRSLLWRAHLWKSIRTSLRRCDVLRIYYFRIPVESTGVFEARWRVVHYVNWDTSFSVKEFIFKQEVTYFWYAVGAVEKYDLKREIDG